MRTAFNLQDALERLSKMQNNTEQMDQYYKLERKTDKLGQLFIKRKRVVANGMSPDYWEHILNIDIPLDKQLTIQT